MEQLITSLKDWPVIVQGAVGSALFWIVLSALQALIRKVGVLRSKHSQSSRKSWLVSRLTKCQAFQIGPDGYAESAFNVSVLIYRSLRDFFIAMMWLCLGLLLQPFVPMAGTVGFMGCLFYILKAYEDVRPLGENIDLKKEEEKIRIELVKEGVIPDIKSSKRSPVVDSMKAPPEDS